MKMICFSLIILILFSFQNLRAQTSEIASVKTSDETLLKNYPDIPDQLLNSEIVLTNDERIKLADYKNDVIVLCFVAEWAGPAWKTIEELNKLYSENLKSVRIIAVSTEDIKSDFLNFKKFVKKFKIEFQAGWADQKFVEEFIKISKFNGIPQSFVIKDGKLRGVFTSALPKVSENLKETVRKVSAEEN